MKLRYLLPLAGVLCTFLTAHAQPSPARQAFYEGACRISPRTMLCYETPLAPLAAYLREYINVETASDSMSADDAIVLSTDPTLGGEAFRLTVLPQRIEIAGGSYGGVFNGVQALFRLLPAEIYAKNCPLPVEIACTKVEDAPRFPYRGMMLDVARTWIDAAGVKRYIDLLSYHGINKLHLHLSDDEGWRIEIRSHPELTEIGGFRGGDSPVRPVYGKWDEKYGGYYTQDEMRGLIRYAAARNIEIIPEIDLPGHSRNIASVHPEIRCNYPPDTVSTNGYDYRSAWCVAREENYALLTDILGDEDALGDMDFKIAGTAEGVTAVQMDIKITGLTTEIMRKAMRQAHEARLHILGEMKKAIDGPRAELSKYAPQHAEVFVNPEVIRMIIGPGGKNIKAITAATGASVDIEDSGRISIFAPTAESMEQAKELVQYYDQRPDLGKNYMGKVRKVLEIGAIVEIMPNVEALVHISQLDTSRVAQASDVAHLGEDMLVKVIEINGDRIRASRKAVLLEEQGIEWKPEDTARPARAPRGEGDRDHRGDRGDRGERRERRPRRD